jgi:hypothetical protein
MTFPEVIAAVVQFVSDYGDVVTALGVSAVIVYLFFEINEEFFLSILRPVGRALLWVHQRLFLIYAWVAVLVSVCGSIVFGCLAWNGSPVPIQDFWPLAVLALFASLCEYIHERFK